MALEWAKYLATFGFKVGVKIGLNTFVLPGSSSVVDFTEALICFKNGDNFGGVINTISGVADIVTCGMVGATKEAMSNSAKGGVVKAAKETAKKAGKKATKKVGQELSRQLAMGTINGGKDAAILTAKETAREASKAATTKVGQQVAKDIARGLVPDVVEDVWRAGTKITLKKIGEDTWLAFVSSGGNQIFETIFEHVGEKVVTSGMENAFSELINQGNKKFFSEFTQNAAKAAAKEAFEKNAGSSFINELLVSTVKGTIRNQGTPK